MQFPPIESEKIEVKNFLALQDATVEISDVCAIIGPQASGKSIIAKLQFFFRQYIVDLFHIAAVSDGNRPTFNKDKVKEFYSLFPGAETQSKDFELSYRTGNVSVTVSRKGADSKTKITISKLLIHYCNQVRREYKKFIISNDEYDENFTFSSGALDFQRQSGEVTSFYRSLPYVLFVPASRAFFLLLEMKFSLYYLLRNLLIRY